MNLIETEETNSVKLFKALMFVSKILGHADTKAVPSKEYVDMNILPNLFRIIFESGKINQNIFVQALVVLG